MNKAKKFLKSLYHLFVSPSDIHGNGDIISESRLAGRPFDSFEITGPFLDISFRRADAYEVSVRTDSNVLPYIITSLSAGVLHIRHERPHGALFQQTKRPHIEIKGPMIENIVVYNAVNLEVHDLRQPRLRIDFRGAGDIVLSGVVPSLKLNASGDVGVNASDLHTLNTDLRASSLVEAEIRASASVNITASDSDGIEVKIRGNPVNLHVDVDGYHGVCLDLLGEARSLSLRAKGSVEIRARNLHTQEAKLSLSGYVKAEIQSCGDFDIDATKSATVKVTRTPLPAVQQHTTASGLDSQCSLSAASS